MRGPRCARTSLANDAAEAAASPSGVLLIATEDFTLVEPDPIAIIRVAFLCQWEGGPVMLWTAVFATGVVIVFAGLSSFSCRTFDQPAGQPSKLIAHAGNCVAASADPEHKIRALGF